jgi:hypothetical protein
VEFSGGIINKLIAAFFDSPYLTSYNYANALNELVEIFFYFKNETLDEVPDDELIAQMKKCFDGACRGDLSLLQGREMEDFAAGSVTAVRGNHPEKKGGRRKMMSDLAKVGFSLPRKIKTEAYFPALLENACNTADFRKGSRRHKNSLISFLASELERLTNHESTSVKTETAENCLHSILYAVGIYLKSFPGEMSALSLCQKESVGTLCQTAGRLSATERRRQSHFLRPSFITP